MTIPVSVDSIECSLETKVGELNKDDAIDLMKSIVEVDPSVLETYEMDFY